MYNMDRLFEAVAAKGHVCVGLDTAPDYVPEKERRAAASDAEAVLAYNRAIIEATADIAACFKVQIAYYEELGLAGLNAYSQTLAAVRAKGVPVIADIKRGDIADTASRYARAHFSGSFEADFVTLSPYLGADSLEPWLEWADKQGKGAFVLVKTSNKGRRDFQELELGGGSPPLASSAADAAFSASPPPGGSAPKPPSPRLYDAIAKKLSLLAESRKGVHGYGAFGAVIGVDPKTSEDRDEALAIRSRYENLFFLIPGYGAQGGAASDAALLLKNGNGGVVNASRSIIKAWASAPDCTPSADNAFAGQKAREAALAMRDSLRKAAAV